MTTLLTWKYLLGLTNSVPNTKYTKMFKCKYTKTTSMTTLLLTLNMKIFAGFKQLCINRCRILECVDRKGNIGAKWAKIPMRNICCWLWIGNPAGNYLFKVKNRNTKTRCEICSSKSTIKTPELCQFHFYTPWKHQNTFGFLHLVNIFHNLL